MATTSGDYYGEKSSSEYTNEKPISTKTLPVKKSPGSSTSSSSSSSGTSSYNPQSPPITVDTKTAIEAKAAAEKAAAEKAALDRKYEVRFIKQEDLERLGYDETYLGLPMSVGYWEGDKWVETRSALDQAQQMHDLRNLERPEMIDLTSTPAYNDLVNLSNQLASGELVAQDEAEGRAYFEELMGFSPGGYSDRLSSMEGLLSGGIQGQQGLSDEQRDLYNRQTQIQLQQMRDDSSQLMQSLGASGRSVAGFQAMLDLSRNQADFQAGRDLELLTQDLMVKQAEYEALSNRYEQLFQMGNISIGQYSSALRENRMAAIQGYAQQITTMAQQNQQNLEAYETHAQVMYNNLMADLGVSKGLLDEAATHYEMYMAPIVAAREEAALEDEKKSREHARMTGNISLMLSGAATGATVGAAFGGIGAPIGAAVGFLAGAISWLFP